ncbi:15968_t:CDS:2 [Racocetra fulgida]|uniref:15968_t:CDS:1 n=1 Tax=Racocetra fulgida TaxID=60492 RepID=A0A9N9F265_9GLOM|nr:15968_t:CDS:2 [Racocetra fulgida]
MTTISLEDHENQTVAGYKRKLISRHNVRNYKEPAGISDDNGTNTLENEHNIFVYQESANVGNVAKYIKLDPATKMNT